MSQVLKKEAIKEILLCARDPIYFINKYCKTQHINRGLVPLKLYPYQEQTIKHFLAYPQVIVNKPRQMGYTTITAAFITWLILFHNDKSVMVISTKADVAKNLIRKVKLMIKYLPSYLFLADIKENQAHRLGLSNGSWVKSISTSKDAGRSEALSYLIIDEAAHIENMDEIWTSAGSTTATGGRKIVLSTPLGMGNWFHRMYKGAEEKTNEFVPLTVNWWENPDYNSDLKDDIETPGGKTSSWFRKETAGWSKQQIAQELLTSFIDSGNTFIDPSIIQYYEKNSCEPIAREYIDRNFWIWKQPFSGKKYIVGADTAGGGHGGTDFCAAVVMDVKECEIVAEYKGKLTPDVFADFLVWAASKYNNALIIPENNGVGLATSLVLKRTDYKNVGYFDPDSTKILDRWTAEYKGLNPGYPMTSKSRPVILSKMQEFLNTKILKSYSIRMVTEMQTFIVQNAKPQALKGMNDDLVMSMALAIWIRDVCPEFTHYSSNMDMAKLYNSVSVSSTSLSDIKRYDDKVAKEKEKIKKIMERQANIGAPHATINTNWILKI